MVKPTADGKLAVTLSTFFFDEEGVVEKRNGAYFFQPLKWTSFAATTKIVDTFDGVDHPPEFGRKEVGTAKTGEDLIPQFTSCGCLNNIPSGLGPVVAALRQGEKTK
jgi:hypothetical protein